MNILHVSNNYKPYLGGVTRSLQTWRAALTQHGHTVYLVTLDFLAHQQPEQNVFRVPSLIRFQLNGKYIAIPLAPKKLLSHVIKELKPDIIHVHHPFLLGKTALGLAREFRIPIVFTYHTRYEEYLHYIPVTSIITQPLLQQRLSRFCNAIDGIVAPSKSIQRFLQETFNIQKNITVIPTPLDDEFVSCIGATSQKKYTRLLYVGRFEKEKNILFLLRVLHALPTFFTLQLVGYGSELKALQDYAFSVLGLSPSRVIFTIKPTRQELLHYFKQAGIFIFASQSETQGIVLLEAMATGAPVIALSGSGSNDLIEHGVNGLLVNNEQEMVDAILRVFRVSNFYQKLANEGKLVAQNHTPGMLCEKLVSFYQKVIKSC